VGVGHPVEQPCVGPGEKHQFHAVDHSAHRTHRLNDRPEDVDQRLSVHRVGGVEEHEFSHSVGGSVADTGDDHPAVAVVDQDHVAYVLVVRHRDDVGDVPVEVDRAVEQV
jgi:hypothetical protein